MISNASPLICIFKNFNENIKITEKINSLNKLISDPNYHGGTLSLSQYYHMTNLFMFIQSGTYTMKTFRKPNEQLFSQ